jgi:hypothetical protein
VSNPKRFVVPIEMARPRYSHRLECFSHKLNRRLRLYDRAPFECWLRIESDPLVRAFCERPGHLNPPDGPRLIDFWVCFEDREEFWVVELDADAAIWSPVRMVDVGRGERIPVRQIRLQDLLAWRVATQNWEQMLPYMNATRSMISEGLLTRVLECVATPRQLGTIERELAPIDPMLVRASIFTLVHRGLAIAPTLETKPHSRVTQFVQVRNTR